MKPPGPGEYSDCYQVAGGRAQIVACCEFCGRTWRTSVASNLVRPVRLILPLQCPSCNQEQYGTPSQGPGPRRTA